MANMSYCRFENTLVDLRDCYHHMDDEELNKKEIMAREDLINLCIDIAQDYGHEVNREVELVNNENTAPNESPPTFLLDWRD
jgi:hypothetical protein